LALAIAIFAAPATLVAILAGAVGAMLPDPHSGSFTHATLVSPWALSNAFTDGFIPSVDSVGGVSSQIAFASAVAVAAPCCAMGKLGSSQERIANVLRDLHRRNSFRM
jgi:hypothetical protein